MKDYDKQEESSYLKYWDMNNLHGRGMSQKLPVGCFKWVENTSHFSKDFIENYYENSYEGYFLTYMFNFLKNYITFTMIYHYYLKE